MINDYLKMILTSEESKGEKDIDYIITTKFGRSHFSKMVYLTKFKEEQNHCLSLKSFDYLFKIISSAIMSITEDNNDSNNSQLEEAVLLTKCLFKYYK